MEAVITDVMDREVKEHGEVKARASKRRKEKAEGGVRRSTQVHRRIN